MSNARELAELGGSYGTGGFVGMKNRIINGAMTIDQRNAGASVSFATGTNGYALDRWYIDNATDGAFSIEQVEDAPAGFYQSTKLTVTTADASLGATQDAIIGQRIEGLNVTDLGFGTASASTVTLSFWVKSSLTGSFGGSLMNSAYNRAYPFSFTISAANTWEQKTVTIAGDTSGTWLYTNGVGMRVSFSMAAGSSYSGTANAWASSLIFQPTGSTNVIGTSGATFYITGVQLEKGSTATSFDYRPYGTELALCQRYFEKSYKQNFAVGVQSGGYAASPTGSNTVPTGALYSQISFAAQKRTDPTVTIYGYQGGVGKASNANTGVDLAADSGFVNDAGTSGFNARNGSGTSLTTALYGIIYHWTASSEL